MALVLALALVILAGCSSLTDQQRVKLKTTKVVKVTYSGSPDGWVQGYVERSLSLQGFVIASNGAEDVEASLEVTVRQIDRLRETRYVRRDTGQVISIIPRYETDCILLFRHLSVPYKLERM